MRTKRKRSTTQRSAGILVRTTSSGRAEGMAEKDKDVLIIILLLICFGGIVGHIADTQRVEESIQHEETLQNAIDEKPDDYELRRRYYQHFFFH
jgi:hypothetical protein